MTTRESGTSAGSSDLAQEVERLERALAELGAQRERERAEEEPRVRAEKLAAVATLVSGLAHDFNNLLSVIGGNTELAQMQPDLPLPVRANLEQIAAASRRAGQLIQQLQTFSRRRSPSLVPVSIAEVVEAGIAERRATLARGARIELVARAPLPDVLGDAVQLQQLVHHLLANASAAIEGREQGRIDVLLEAAGDATEGARVRLVVRDDGVGMNDTIRQRIFEPFFTTRLRSDGAGLGLSVVDGVVRQMNGTITVSSAPGAGATFEVLMPAAPPPAAAEGDRGKAGAGARVLYIDDEDALVFLAQRLLALRGYSVRAFSNVPDALAAVVADPTAFDIVVTDQNMPGASGIDVARAVREIREDLPVILASGYVDDELERRAAEVGVSVVVEKPDTMEALCDMIRDELGRRSLRD